MKRCPQCEFIYEDDQTRCDMDGNDLVFDHPTAPAPKKTSKRNGSRRSVLSILGVILGVLLLAIGYASLERAVTMTSEPTVVTTASNAPMPAPEENPRRPVKTAEPVVEPAAEDPSVSVVTNTTRTSEKLARDPRALDLKSRTEGQEPLENNSIGTRGAIMGSPRQNRVENPKSQGETVRGTEPGTPPKKDSKIVSAVKKTGRFLTKPF